MKATELERTQRFTVVIGYEDYASGVRALELHQRLLARWADAMDFRLIIWKFEPLGIPSLLAKATEDAFSADLILISLSGIHPLPAEAVSWLARWRGKALKRPGIALLLDAQYQVTDFARQISTFLRAVAHENGSAFFSSGGIRDEVEEANLASHYDHPDVLRGALQTPDCFDHWGLNE